MDHVVDHIIGGINFRENNAPVQSQQNNANFQHDHDENGDGKALPESTPVADGVEAADIVGTAQRPEKVSRMKATRKEGVMGELASGQEIKPWGKIC